MPPVARILMVSQPVDGGVFQHVASLCGGLVAHGHEPFVAAPFDRPPADLEAELLRLPMTRAVSAADDVEAVVGLGRFMRRLRPDLIHAHSSKAGAVARAARPASPRTPVVYTPHGYAFAGYFGNAARARYRAAERVLGRLATRVLCVCEAERALAASVGPARRTRVVHNGIADPAPAEPHPAVDELGGPVIGALSLLRPGKGIETLIDALPAVLAAHPGAAVAIAGEGPDRQQLEARARQRGVIDALHLIGTTPGPMPLLAGADLFVSPSWAESFPYNVLEAMAAGLPVVATDAGGTAEAVDHGRTGLVVPPRDAGALAAALVELLDDRDRRARLGAEGRKRQQERFTLARMVEGTLSVYAEVAD
jgi:glycosyltransferase involved in cell wall biosynthesis